MPLLVGAMCYLGAIKQGTGYKSPKNSPTAAQKATLLNTYEPCCHPPSPPLWFPTEAKGGGRGSNTQCYGLWSTSTDFIAAFKASASELSCAAWVADQGNASALLPPWFLISALEVPADTQESPLGFGAHVCCRRAVRHDQISGTRLANDRELSSGARRSLLRGCRLWPSRKDPVEMSCPTSKGVYFAGLCCGFLEEKGSPPPKKKASPRDGGLAA
jgi:hypothetical protein